MNMLVDRRRQGGWTIWGLITVVALIAFFALLFLKLFPPYMANYKLHKGMVEVLQEPGITEASRRDVLDRLDRILYIDYSDDIVDLKKKLRIEKNKGVMTLRVEYEVVVPMAYNLSALIEFDTKAETRLR